MIRRLNALGHKNLNLSEVYAINCIEVNMLDAMISDRHSKGELYEKNYRPHFYYA